MTDSSDSDEKWTFDCKKCSETRHFDTEVEALNAADDHLEYGLGGHFSFRIISPDGEVTHG